MEKIKLYFGALCPSILDQLLAQDVVKIPDAINSYQENADAITRLFLHGLLTESESHRARTRLIKIILGAINEHDRHDSKAIDT